MTSELEQCAIRFATDRHRGQVRKYTGEPYITHLLLVAEIVRSVPHTTEMIAAALLHDVIEDTTAESWTIHFIFGEKVGAYVDWLTDVSTAGDGSRAERKRLDREHIAKAPPEAKTIKLADLIHNSKNILSLDQKFAATYLAEKSLLLEVLREGDQLLWACAKEIVTAGLEAPQ